jgi:hypothetical protein
LSIGTSRKVTKTEQLVDGCELLFSLARQRLRSVTRVTMTKFHLYIDDSGSRYLKVQQDPRADGMDCFALGGIIVDEDDVSAILERHAAFCREWGLTYPLHSTKIRGRRNNFAWLGKDKATRDRFYSGLDALILDLPIVSIACVIHRPGYSDRYADKYPEPWMLCQTAFSILVERSCKFVRQRDGKLEVFFEESGKIEDRALIAYMKAMKADGMPFLGPDAANYDGLGPADFQSLVLGDPRRVTKQVPMIQVADIVLYAMAKGGYDPSYRPFLDLHTSKRIIDQHVDQSAIRLEGVKYSCFENVKGPVLPEPLKRPA